jgi:diguanylate cyclase (GGDEF)-like protein
MNTENNDSVFIQKTALFSSLSQSEIDFIASRCDTLILSKGSALFSPDEIAKHFYILKSGAIRVFKIRDNGSEDEMAKFTVGDTIGDFDFARGAEYDANATASEDSILIQFPGYGHTVDSLAAENPNTACNILMNAIVMMTDRIKSIQQLILENMSWVQELHRRAYEDSSTGLWKQTFLTDEILTGLKNPSALIMMKPDRFKALVDTRGHHAGDEAMIRIAIIMKKMTRKFGRGWAIRFKSNETGMIFYDCNTIQAEKIAEALAQNIEAMEPVPSQGEIPAFSFSASISWSVWPKDDPNWESFFNGTYTALMDTWRNSQGLIHYRKINNNE